MHPLFALAHTRGEYACRLLAVHAVLGGLSATLELIPFGELGGPRRLVILSGEPLAAQMIETHVANRPPDLGFGQETSERRRATLEIQAVAPRIVRLQLAAGEALPLPRDALGMLAPEARTALGEPATFERREDAERFVATAGEVAVRLDKDPFSAHIACVGAPEVTVATALEDRNVHGLLCTPPPGVVETAEGKQAFWPWALSPDRKSPAARRRALAQAVRRAYLRL
jgi:alpha-D-xyloside xylohydrolase